MVDYYINGLFADRPTAGVQGRLYIPTDWEGVGYYDDGAAWNIVLPDGKIIPEFTSDGMTTTFNVSGGASYGTVQGFKRLTESGTGTLRGRYKTVTPGTTLTLTMCARMHLFPGSDKILWGFFLSRASDDHTFSFCLQHDGGLYHAGIYYTDLATYNSTPYSIGVVNGVNYINCWYKLIWTYATNLADFYISVDGTNYVKTASVTVSNISGVDRAGFTINRYLTTQNSNIPMDIYYFDATVT